MDIFCEFTLREWSVTHALFMHGKSYAVQDERLGFGPA